MRQELFKSFFIKTQKIVKIAERYPNALFLKKKTRSVITCVCSKDKNIIKV